MMKACRKYKQHAENSQKEAVNSGQVRKASGRAGLWIGLSWEWICGDGESTHNRSKVAQVISTAGLLFVTVEADEPGWLSILLESKQLSTLTASIREMHVIISNYWSGDIFMVFWE